jgi:putative methyltransferase (TIGR04325 family)
MTSIKSIARDWLPPVMARAMQRLRGGGNNIHGDYSAWEDAVRLCTGYESEHILSKVLEASIKVKRGEAAYERDSVVFEEIEYAWPITAGLMWVAAQNKGRLNVLDFGGALGSSYFQNHVFLATLPQVRWSVIEQSHYVQAGREHFQNDTLRFYSSFDELLFENNPDVALFSSVLQYLPDPYSVLENIFQSNASFVIIDRTPFFAGPRDLICVQNVPDVIYKASYPIRVFSLDAFINRTVGWEIVSKIQCPEGSVLTQSGYFVTYRGFIMRRKK